MSGQKNRGRGRVDDPLDVQGMLLGQVPPHNPDAELAVLGGVLLRGDILDRLASELRERDFYSPAHAAIWRAMLSLWQASKPIDLVSVAQALTAAGDLEAAGGPAYLAGLTGNTIAAANAIHHARTMRDAAKRRAMIAMGARMLEIAFDPTRETGEFAEIAAMATDQVLGDRVEEGNEYPEEYLYAHASYLERLAQGLDEGVSLPWWQLQDMLGGLRPGEVYVVAARPGCGKSAYALQIAVHGAMQGQASGFVSLEMPWEQLVNRVIALREEIDLQAFRNGHFSDAQWSRIQSLYQEALSWPLYLYDKPARGVSDFRAACRRWRRKKGRLDLLVVDYAQLVRGEGRHATRDQELTAISGDIKALAKELRIPVVVLAQLNRKIEERKPATPGGLPRPLASDLRESGGLEQDADVIIMIPPWHMRERKSDIEFFDVSVVKARNARTGDVPMQFRRKLARFEEREEK